MHDKYFLLFNYGVMSKTIFERNNLILDWRIKTYKEAEKEIDVLDLQFIILVNGKICKFTETLHIEEDKVSKEGLVKWWTIVKILSSLGYYFTDNKISDDSVYCHLFLNDFIQSQRPVFIG